jgi:SAM-dependent methyltransferase
MENNQDAILRTTFNSDAQLYREMRPTYPEELFDTLEKIAKLPDCAHLLEIGPGTGQATIPLAKRGYAITAVELGDELAKIAREELRQYEKVKIITGAFEDIDLPLQSFDIVYAATAFHWIKPEVRFKKPHDLLKSDGYLAIIHTYHVSDKMGDNFFHDLQPIYKKYKNDRTRSTKDKGLNFKYIDELKREDVDEKLFEPIFFKAFPLAVTYTADEYAKLISTYSPTLSMPPERREAFLKEIRAFISEEFNNTVTKHHAMALTIAKKK